MYVSSPTFEWPPPRDTISPPEILATSGRASGSMIHSRASIYSSTDALSPNIHRSSMSLGSASPILVNQSNERHSPSLGTASPKYVYKPISSVILPSEDADSGGRAAVATLLASHDAMTTSFDEHVRRRRNLDVQFSLIGAEIRRLTQTVALTSAQDMSAMGRFASPVSVADVSLAMLSRLECDKELAQLEARYLSELRNTKRQQCSALEEEMRSAEKQFASSSDRQTLQRTLESYEECVACETALRKEENQLVESVDRAEIAAKEREIAKKRAASRVEVLKRQLLDEESAYSVLKGDLSVARQSLRARREEQQGWEQRLRNLKAGDSGDAVRNALEARRQSLTEELQQAEKLFEELARSEAEALRDPTNALVTQKERPKAEMAAMVWDATRPVRSVMLLRETLLVLKANLLNLYDDLDEITDIVEKIQNDPKATMYPAFSEPSNAWRQQRLHEAFQSVVELMKARHYESDVNAAQQLLARMKHFIVVYDLFENHYDAVVNAIMQSEAKWRETEQMLSAAETCRRVISDAAKQRAASSAQLKRRVSVAPNPAGGLAQGRRESAINRR